MFKHCVVPNILAVGTIVPIYKKPGTNPNVPENYRPITVSSVYSKLVELFLSPDDTACSAQFGFRNNRNTSMPCSMLNDIIQFTSESKTPLFICSLDAEK